MSELTEKMNWMLSEIDKNRWISLSKDDTGLTFKAKDKLRAYGLIERQGKYSWRLTLEGYEAVELGGFEHWLKRRESKRTAQAEQHINGENISIITGDKNAVNQTKTKIDLTKKESLTQKIIIGVLISVIAGILLFYITNHLNQNGKNKSSEQSKANYTGTPITLEFTNGEKGVLYYSINLELIDTLLIKTGNFFGGPDKAINFLNSRIRNELIVSFEKAEPDSARAYRKEISTQIIELTKKDQIYSGYRIIALNINEIKAVANN